MPDTNDEQNYTRVDTGAMREASAAMRESLKAIQAACLELDTCQKWLQVYWEGSAEEQYEKAYSKALAGVLAAYVEYQRLPQGLDQHAEDYEKAHGAAVLIADSIEQAQWADVTGIA